MTASVQLSVIIPVKNEAKNLKELVVRIHKALSDAKISYEIIAINDHSTDNSVAILNELAKLFPIVVQDKKGRPGKAFSILEGSNLAHSEYIAVIDADLQYAPEALPDMFAKVDAHGVVIANRKIYKSSFLRRWISRANKFVFGRLLHGLNLDVQSGLKIFRKEIIEHIDQSRVKAWSLDIPLLYTARELGFSIGEVDITFELRQHGTSHVRLTSAYEVAFGSLALKLQQKRTYHIPPTQKDAMLGAGVAYNRKRYITHTTLEPAISALVTFTFWQHVLVVGLLTRVAAGLLVDPHATVVGAIAIISILYFVDVLFNLLLIGRSLHSPPEIEVTRSELDSLTNENLPIYSILCPLYKEAHVLPQFVKSISLLDYPKDKLDVLLLLEQDDTETIQVAKAMRLPPYIRILVVPHTAPKTKPKACNYGLAHAKGEYVVIYDAEDAPDSLQLKKAYLAFKRVDPTVVCLQAKLNYYNPHQNLITRLFTAEYSLWFDVVLPGLQSMQTALPLGGTSNHFRIQALRNLKGWDAFNVTEDCDLGVRLFKKGYQTAIINSTTLEEANSRPLNWLAQRSRWIKGYMQTYLVHMRNPLQFVREHGVHALLFQLTVGGKILSMFLNPFMWLVTIIYFAFRPIVGTFIESFFPGPILYFGVFCLVFGNFLAMYYYMIAVAKKEQWNLMKFVFCIPFYWLAMSIAGWRALLELFISPFYWSKTVHGFHIKPTALFVVQKKHNIGIIYAGILVAASFITHFINFLGSTYLARASNVSFEQLGIISLVGSFLALSDVPIGAFRRTLVHRISFVIGKFKLGGREMWLYYLRRCIAPAIVIMILWDILSPYTSKFFQTGSTLPILLFGPVWILAMISAVNNAYLSATQKFHLLAIVVVVESISKLLFTYTFVQFAMVDFVYLAIPLSICVSMLVAARLLHHMPQEKRLENHGEVQHFPKGFFASSVMLRISSVLFLTMDVVLAKHYLDPTLAGQYALLSTVGKMVYLFGSQFAQFINPVISRMEGARLNSKHVFAKLFVLTAAVTSLAFVVLGMFGQITVPLLMGPKTSSILVYVLPYTFIMALFAMSDAIVSYHQIRKNYFFPFLSLLAGTIQVVGIIYFHESITAIIRVMIITSVGYFGSTVLFHLAYDVMVVIGKNVGDLFGLVENLSIPKTSPAKLRILIFNWRDTKHKWAGGAEAYVYELSKEWVKSGHKVTIFCGNDGTAARNQVLDGVQIVRRGGFYTVYVWAFLYYILRFRGSFDVAIDSVNGVPFFAKLYTRIPTFLLVYHVHQEVFQRHLPFLLSTIARVIEAKLLPIVYNNTKVITISRSSENEIVRMGLAKKENIEIVTPGVHLAPAQRISKTSYPSFLYLGRLKPYKNIDVAIRSFAAVLTRHRTAKLTIAGFGESRTNLENLAKELKIERSVVFEGRVSEELKTVLLTKSWVVLQPSSIEGWGMTVMEANACGTPVIASNVPGLRDSVANGQTGLLVQPRNVLSLVSAMEKMMSDASLRRDFAKRALALSKSHRWDQKAFDFQAIMEEKLVKHYGYSYKVSMRI